MACPGPLPWRYPSGFAGISHATVLGLGVWWSVRGLLVVALWLWWVSMVWAMCVFEGVVCLLAEVWVAPLVVVGVDGVGYLRVRTCSRVWACLVAVV